MELFKVNKSNIGDSATEYVKEILNAEGFEVLSQVSIGKELNGDITDSQSIIVISLPDSNTEDSLKARNDDSLRNRLPRQKSEAAYHNYGATGLSDSKDRAYSEATDHRIREKIDRFVDAISKAPPEN